MNKGRFLRFLKEPNGYFLIVLYAVTAVTVALSVYCAAASRMGVLSYIVFVLAALCLGYSVYTLVRCLPGIRQSLKERASRHDFTRKIVENYGFRTVAFSCVTFALNTGFAVFYGVMGLLVHSLWYGALAAYYIFLSVIRLWVLIGGRRAVKNAAGDEVRSYEYKLKIFRSAGIFLLVLEVVLPVAFMQMMSGESPNAHTEITAIASAAYSFYKIALALVNMFKAKKNRDPLAQSLRNINLTDALVSLLALQTSLIALYSEGDENMMALNVVVGLVIFLSTAAMGIFMIARGCFLLKRLETERKGDDIPGEDGNE